MTRFGLARGRLSASAKSARAVCTRQGRAAPARAGPHPPVPEQVEGDADKPFAVAFDPADLLNF